MSARPRLLTGEDLPPAPRQGRSLDKRERLLAAGLSVFGEKGYENSAINEIAARARLAVGGFYQHFRSKRQLLLALMDELLERLSQVHVEPAAAADVRAALHDMLSRVFSLDLRYLGAYRAWQEAVLSEPDLARKHAAIHKWTTNRVLAVFELLHRLPGARRDVDLPGLARAMDVFFWSLLAQALRMPKPELNRWIRTATHLIYHAMFTDSPPKGRTS